MAMRTMTCTCKNEYQDKKYGVGIRLFNQMKKEGLWRCTSCGMEKSA